MSWEVEVGVESRMGDRTKEKRRSVSEVEVVRGEEREVEGVVPVTTRMGRIVGTHSAETVSKWC